MGEIYQQHRDEDGFLYMAYGGENTFGRKLTAVTPNGTNHTIDTSNSLKNSNNKSKKF